MGGEGCESPGGARDRTAAVAPSLLEVEGLTKRYGATVALDRATFSLARGEVLAALGQNGAGKSTLVKLLAGVVQPTAGDVRLDGAPLALHGARDALRRGIVLIPQELAYVRDLSVAENVLLGSWAARGGYVSRRALRAAAMPFAAEVGLERLLDVPMSQMTLAQCQLAEIAKALSRDARILLLDEPTAALSDAEGLALFAALDRLRERGVAMIYISHRLDEVLARTDRLLVLRDGCVVADRPTAGATRAEVIEQMLGHRHASVRPQAPAAPAASARDERPLLSLRGVAHRGRGLRKLTLDVHRGEIVGLFGVAGSGHETAALMLAGLFPHDAGELYLDGALRDPIRTPRQARRLGIRYVPPERKRQGLVLAQSVRANMTFPQLDRFARWGVMRAGEEEALVRTAAARLSLRYDSASQPVQELSGGNQQKVLLASRIYAEPKLLVIQEPSRGVDVAARDEIHELVVQIARSGRTIVFATSDVEEAVALSDRLLVLRDGRLEATLERGTKSEANALAAAGRSELED